MSARDVRQIVAFLEAQGSPEHAAGVQWFFKEAIRSHGWRTADLRRYARDLNKRLSADPARLLDVAERLFGGRALEEKVLGVLVLQRSLKAFGAAEFRRFEGWLPRVTTWADHDALAMFLLGPLMTAAPRRATRVFAWATSRNHWVRRASAVSLIDGVRHGLFSDESARITGLLVADADDMVQKGLGWLLREWGKVRPRETVPLLLSVREHAPRLVLRTACERLPSSDRTRILR